MTPNNDYADPRKTPFKTQKCRLIENNKTLVILQI
jgi:hypothetical protein